MRCVAQTKIPCVNPSVLTRHSDGPCVFCGRGLPPEGKPVPRVRDRLTFQPQSAGSCDIYNNPDTHEHVRLRISLTNFSQLSTLCMWLHDMLISVFVVSGMYLNPPPKHVPLLQAGVSTGPLHGLTTCKLKQWVWTSFRCLPLWKNHAIFTCDPRHLLHISTRVLW